jgi:hypothetical protein
VPVVLKSTSQLEERGSSALPDSVFKQLIDGSGHPASESFVTGRKFISLMLTPAPPTSWSPIRTCPISKYRAR